MSTEVSLTLASGGAIARRAALPALTTAGVLALVLACFGPVLFQQRQFGYRDAGHFYYPLYHRVQQEWAAGRIPLWEPEENGGMPLLGNPTAAVLYPGKAVYFLFSYDWATRLYTIGHTLLAGAMLARLLRSWQVSWTGAAIGGIAYAFGAPVLFQYCNIIFLVGAAWTPLALQGADQWLRLGRRWGIIELACGLAMQTLGGDPQAAYVTGLCTGGYALGLSWGDGRAAKLNSGRIVAGGLLLVAVWVAATLALAHAIPIWLAVPAGTKAGALRPLPSIIPADWFPGRRGLTWLLSPRFWRVLVNGCWAVVGTVMVLRWARSRTASPLRGRLAGLTGAAALGFALMGAQMLPVLEFTRRSVRAAEDGPHEMYPFSVPALRVAEFAWPNVFGSSFGRNRNWLAVTATGPSAKIWVPSLYLGGLTIALALSGGAASRARPERVWMTAITLCGLVLSFGEYASPLFGARHFERIVEFVGPHDPDDLGEQRRDGFLADGEGSPYWLLARTLPGFETFRYPSKLLTFAVLGLAALAGFGWDRACADRAKRPAIWALSLAVAGFGLLGVAYVRRDALLSQWASTPRARGGSPWGPFDERGAFAEMRQALVHGTIVMGLAALVISSARRWPKAASGGAVVLLVADLALANAAIVVSVPETALHGEPELLERIRAAESRDPAGGPYRIHRMPLWDPSIWIDSGSDVRAEQFVTWERKTIQPKYAIDHGGEYVLTQGVSELFDYWFFFAPFKGNHGDRVGKAIGLGPGEKAVYYPRRGYDLWNTRYFVLPFVPQNDEHRGIAAFLADTETVAPRPQEFTGPGGGERQHEWGKQEDWQILKNKNAFPRAWVVHDGRFIPPITGMGKAQRQPWMEEILYQADPYWNNRERHYYDPRVLAWIETHDVAGLRPYLPRTAPTATEQPVITRYEPRLVEIDVRLEAPGIVILADVYYPGWSLTIDGRPATILQVNRLMRGAAVPAGPHRLVYRYWPDSFRNGVVISGAGLLALALIARWARRQAQQATVGGGP
jgi:hypothetical protein